MGQIPRSTERILLNLCFTRCLAQKSTATAGARSVERQMIDVRVDFSQITYFGAEPQRTLYE